MLNTGVQLAFSTKLAEGLAGASPDNLAEIEISPVGLGRSRTTAKAAAARQNGRKGGRPANAPRVRGFRQYGTPPNKFAKS